MNVLIAKNAGECSVWTGCAVVIDVLRGSTTVASLLAKGANRNVVVCSDEQTVTGLVQQHPDFAVLSDVEITLPHQDNSPYLAEKLSSRQSVFLLSPEVGQACLSLRQSSHIFVGGFCNFRALVQAARNIGQDVLLVPATIFGSTQDDEDLLCARAFKEFCENISRPEAFVEAFKTTVRLVELLQSGIPTIQHDLSLGFNLNSFSVVPQVAFSQQGSWAVCFPEGRKPDPAWGTIEDKPARPQVPEQPQFATMMDLNLRPMVEKTLLASQLMPQPAAVPPSVPKIKSPQKGDMPQLKTRTVSIQPLGGGQSAPSTQVPPTPEKHAGLRGFFSGLVRSVKEEAAELEKSFRREKPIVKSNPPGDKPGKPQEQATPKPVEPQQVAPQQPVPPAEQPADNSDPQDGVVLSDDKTLSCLSMPREGMHSANAHLLTERQSENPFQREDYSHEAPPITAAPRSGTPRDRVLELSIFDKENEIKLKSQTVQPEQPEQLKPQPKQPPVQPVAPQPAPQPISTSRKKAIVLFSGGLDSTTCLYWALAQGYACEALTVTYGQRHVREVSSAQAIARKLGIKHHIIDLKLPWLSSSSLVDNHQPLPDIPVEQITRGGVPSTYVPGRNLMFLSVAGSLLDSVGADAIVAGPNAVDFSGYPDCTPAFFKAATEALNRGTMRGVRNGIDVLAPLMTMSKAEIIKLAVQLKVPLQLTWSCYAGGDKPCGKCDSCKLRAKGFAEAGYKDPAL